MKPVPLDPISKEMLLLKVRGLLFNDWLTMFESKNWLNYSANHILFFFPEVCELCGKKIISNRKQHMRQHQFHRPKKCTYCEKEFPAYQRMSMHRKIAHRELWDADKERLMAEEGSMYTPEQSREKNKRYNVSVTCDVCGVRLSSRGQLNLHMKARHGTGLPGYGQNPGGRGNPGGRRGRKRVLSRADMT